MRGGSSRACCTPLDKQYMLCDVLSTCNLLVGLCMQLLVVVHLFWLPMRHNPASNKCLKKHSCCVQVAISSLPARLQQPTTQQQPQTAAAQPYQMNLMLKLAAVAAVVIKWLLMLWTPWWVVAVLKTQAIATAVATAAALARQRLA